MLAAVVGVVVLVVALLARGGGSPFPDSIAGQPRNTSPQARALVDVMREFASAGGDKASAEFYGSLSGPGVLVAMARENVPDLSVAFVELAQGFETSNVTNLNVAAESNQQDGPAQLECAPYSGKVSGYLCAWSDGQTVGVVMSIGDVSPDGLDLVAEVYESVTRH